MKLFREQNWLAAVLGALALALASCDKNPNGPSSPPTNEKFAQTATARGVEVYRSVQTFEQVKRALAGPEALGNINMPAVGSLQKAGVNFKPALAPLQQETRALVQKTHGLSKTQGDTVIYDKRWIDPLTGINHHHWISYNTGNGKATIYLVATNHPTNQPLERDSSRIVVNVKFTIGDPADDVVELVENVKDYRAGYRLRYEEGRIIPDAYQPGNEPKGGVLEGLSVYASGQDTTEIRQRLEYHETAGGLGSWAKAVSFRDGSRHTEDVTFRNGQVLFNIVYRDGTREQGQFHAPDENNLTFEKTVTYPSGSDPRSVFEKGDFSRNPVDSSGTANFSREVFFANGTSERYTVKITETHPNGFARLEVTETNSDGTGGSWTLQAGPTKADLNGFWINEEKQYILFNASFYNDGSADMHIEVYASKEAYDNGEPPIFKADLHFRPDGSGNGTLTSKEGTSNFSFSANGAPKS